VLVIYSDGRSVCTCESFAREVTRAQSLGLTMPSDPFKICDVSNHKVFVARRYVDFKRMSSALCLASASTSAV